MLDYEAEKKDGEASRVRLKLVFSLFTCRVAAGQHS